MYLKNCSVTKVFAAIVRTVSMFHRITWIFSLEQFLLVRQLLTYLCFKMFVKAADYLLDTLSTYCR